MIKAESSATCLIGTDNTAGKQVEMERQRIERALQETNVELEGAKSTAEKANLAKSDFLSSMSHELRSPLNAILGFAQLMESASPAPTAGQTESIAQILQAGWYLLKLIDEILDLAAIESGTASPSKEAVSLSEILVECQTMMEPRARQPGIRMTFPSFEAHIYVWADRTRLKQIVINLLSNAIKYNKEQGTVVVDCSVSDLRRVRFCVTRHRRGTFSGQAGATLPAIQPSGPGGQRRGRHGHRSGGDQAIGRTNGRESSACPARSESAARFAAICRPLSRPSSLRETTKTQPRPNRRRRCGAPLRTLLYVEDNPANLILVERLIARRPDMQLLSAINGTLGIELARVHQPEVILMDINLPGISGIKALKILREDPATAHIPVVALSANAMPHDIAKGLGGGILRLSHQADKNQRLHGHAQRGPGVCSKNGKLGRTTAMISASDILKASILIVDDQAGRRLSPGACAARRWLSLPSPPR